MKDQGTGQGGYSSGAWPFKWVCHGEHPCKMCAVLDGTVKSLDEWRMSIQPGFHEHCHCKLEAEKSLEYDELEGANPYCIYSEKREEAHWNTSAAEEVISGSDIPVPEPEIPRCRLPDSKWDALE